ncbi:MAG: formylglycine-generating enzyme family protein [Planctomycetota bacterium]
MTFAVIPAGEFAMGRGQTYWEILRLTTIHAGVDRAIETEVPQHTVRLDSFLMQTTEVTQQQWHNLMGTQPWQDNRSFVKEGGDYPVSRITWNDAIEFCKRLSKADGNTYRLPTEAEWEYACRARTSTIYSFGDESSQMEHYGWIADNSHSIGESYAHRVAQQKPNPWSLFDMHGNVWEWCSDRYQNDYYTVSTKINPLGPELGDTRVIRGGSWRSSDTHARSTFRFGIDPSSAENDLGFRVVMELTEPTTPDGEPDDALQSPE